ncbi:OsmC-like protein [Bradyrhizobiaceae bacterium SG-6C]|nr:OsmC-like protein [Bradyrhizobiaceae bacterium SG-6C]
MRVVPLTFETDARAGDGMRNEVAGSCLAPAAEFPPFVMATDEDPYHGGARSAPPPQAFFITGLVTCFLTQMRAFAPARGVLLDHIAVRACVEWEAHLDGSGPCVAHGRAITLDMEIDSPADLEKLRDLVRVTSRACYVEALLALPVRHGLWRGDDWIEMDEPRGELAS